MQTPQVNRPTSPRSLDSRRLSPVGSVLKRLEPLGSITAPAPSNEKNCASEAEVHSQKHQTRRSETTVATRGVQRVRCAAEGGALDTLTKHRHQCRRVISKKQPPATCCRRASKLMNHGRILCGESDDRKTWRSTGCPRRERARSHGGRRWLHAIWLAAGAGFGLGRAVQGTARDSMLGLIYTMRSRVRGESNTSRVAGADVRLPLLGGPRSARFSDTVTSPRTDEIVACRPKLPASDPRRSGFDAPARRVGAHRFVRLYWKAPSARIAPDDTRGVPKLRVYCRNSGSPRPLSRRWSRRFRCLAGYSGLVENRVALFRDRPHSFVPARNGIASRCQRLRPRGSLQRFLTSNRRGEPRSAIAARVAFESRVASTPASGP